MKTKRLIILVLSCILAFSLVSCDILSIINPSETETESETETKAKNETLSESESESKSESDTEEDDETDTETETEEIKEIVDMTYNVAESIDNIKTHGRTSLGDSGLFCDNVATGIEFNAYIEGDLTVKLTISRGSVTTNGTVEKSLNDDCYFTLIIDGIRVEERIKAARSSTSTLTLATFEEGGVHNVRLIKQTEPRNALCCIETVSFKGYFEERPADNKYYLEFIGASTSCGYGNLTTVSSAAEAQKSVNQDSTQAFPYLTAQLLGADHSAIGASGIGLVRGFRPFNMPFMFGMDSAYRSQTEFHDPVRIPDAVIINLSGNDYSKGVTADEWRAGAMSFIAQIRGVYGEDTPIIWIYAKENTYFPTLTQNIFNDLGGEENGLYLCRTTNNTDGGNGHHSIAGQNVVAGEIAAFITEKNILK